MITFACSRCGKSLTVKDELAGKTGKCSQCQQPARVPESAPRSPPTHAPAASRARKSTASQETLPPRHGGHRPDAETQAGVSPAGLSPEHYDFLAPAQSPEELGRLGPYRVLQVLGAGGMGVVFLAEDPSLKRKLALKAMLPSLAASDSARQRFLREAQTAASIEHDHIVPIYQVGEDRGVPFISMPFLKGEPLDTRLKRDRLLPLPETLRIGREVARGLAAAHERGLIHRDIKPANLWLEEPEGRIKILDFGLARAADGPQLTQSGAIIGTPAYMAPEQASGGNVDARSDLFSLGCLLYQLCTGEVPFKGTDVISTLMAVATEQPKAPNALNPEVPAELSRLILRLLAKKPEQRPASAREVGETLRELEAGGPARSSTAAVKQRRASSQEEDRPHSEADGDREPPSRARKAISPRVRASLVGPARALLITGLLTAMTGLTGVGYLGLAAGTGASLFGLHRIGSVAACLLVVVSGVAIYVGGLRMQEMASYRWAWAAGLLSVLPVSFWPAGLPTGIWTLLTLRRREVRRGFETARQLPQGGAMESGLRYRIIAGSLGGVAVVLVLTVVGSLLAYRTGQKAIADSSRQPGPNLPVETLPAQNPLTERPAIGPANSVEGPEDRWIQQVATLTAEQQVEAVAARLRQLNPKFTEKLAPTIDRGIVTGLQFRAYGVTNISPLRALRGLQSLSCGGWGNIAPLSDLSPLRGLRLNKIVIPFSRVSDLSPLQGMPLKVLDCGYSPVSDLGPLAGMPLEEITCHHTRVADLSPLKGMPLRHLSLLSTKITDLSPLAGMKLEKLWVASTQVSDLSPLKGMPLIFLACRRAKVEDLSPLQGSSLRWIECDFQAPRDAGVLRSIAKLETINGKPVKEVLRGGDEPASP